MGRREGQCRYKIEAGKGFRAHVMTESQRTEPASRRLASWKEIASYLDRSVSTVQRWERSEGLPVHRHEHDRQGSIYAHSAEIDAWVEQRRRAAPELQTAAPRPRRRLWWAAAAAALILAAFAAPVFEAEQPVVKEMAARPLTAFPGIERDPSLSPDGRQVAFIRSENDYWGESDLFLMDIATGASEPLTSQPGREYSPAFSPDGRRIAFVRAAANIGEKITGGVPAAVVILDLSSDPPEERSIAQVSLRSVGNPLSGLLAWSPNGRFLAVQHRGPEDGTWALYRINVESGQLERLTSPGDQTDGDDGPAFSLSGHNLAFTRNEGERELFVLSLGPDGRPVGEAKKLAKAGFATGPAWTPDERIVYSRGLAGSRHLHRIDPNDESRLEKLPYVGGDGEQPTLSHGRMVYVRKRFEENIWAVRLNAGRTSVGQPWRVIESTSRDAAGVVSPDGSKIAFSSARSGSPEIWVANADGSDAYQVTNLPGAWVGSPRWSPGGELIGFNANPSGTYDVYVVPVIGGAPRQVTSSGADDLIFGWSHDGGSLYCLLRGPEGTTVWRRPARGGTGERILQTPTGYGFSVCADCDDAIYYLDGSDGRNLVRHHLAKGRVTNVRLVEKPARMAAGRDGVLYLKYPDSDGRSELRYFRFSDGQAILVAEVWNPTSSVSLSRDGKVVLFSQMDKLSKDLMIVEGFE